MNKVPSIGSLYILSIAINKNITFQIIHNYGHGGGGITFHWGCAREAADIAKSVIDNINSIATALL